MTVSDWLRALMRQRWMALFAALLVIGLIIVGYSLRADADDGELNTGERVITLYDLGEEQSFVTTENTVEEALLEAEVELNPRDRVEPARDDELLADSYTVNIYRARPLLVVDSDKDGFRQVVMTAAQSRDDVADDAGLVLYDEDETEFQQNRNILTDGAAEKFIINRATPIKLTLFGETFTARTQAETVGEFLKEKSIELSDKDRISLPGETPIEQNMKLRIWREGKQTVTVDEPIDFDVEVIQDRNRDVGYREVTTKGAKGEKSVTYVITIRDGKEVKRQVISSYVKKRPKKQVEVRGAKYNLPAGSHQDWMRAAGIAESDFGFVNYIVNNENASWHPCRVQGPGHILDCTFAGTAQLGYGLVQATPGSKMSSAGSDWRTNPVTQLKWANDYAVGRYGSWQAAYQFKEEHGWW